MPPASIAARFETLPPEDRRGRERGLLFVHRLITHASGVINPRSRTADAAHAVVAGCHPRVIIEPLREAVLSTILAAGGRMKLLG